MRNKVYFVFLIISLILYLPIIVTPHLFLDRGNDLTEFFYPIYYFVKQNIKEGQIPFWNTMFLSGTPLLPDPQSPLFYLPNVLFLLIPINWAFIFTSVLHTALSGLGAYYLSRKGLNLSKKQSILAGTIYLLSPRLSAFIEAGHIGLIFASAWIPFAALSVLMLIKKPEFKWSLLLAFSLSGIFYTHPTTVVLATSLFTILFFINFIFVMNQNKLRSMKYFILGGLLTFFLTAPALIPQLSWVPNTNRALLVTDRQVWPIWPSFFDFMKNLVNPLFWGPGFYEIQDTEKWIAIGVFSIIFSAIGFLHLKKKIQIGIALVFFTIVLLSANNLSPFYEIFLDQEWYVFARVTTRSWFVVSLIVSILIPLGIARFKKKIRPILVMLVIAELFAISWAKITKPIQNDRQIAPKSVFEYIAKDKEIFRIFCTTRCFSQKDVAEYGMETIGGYSTLHQKNYYQHAWQLTGVYWNYYTLTLPPIGSYKFGELNPDYMELGLYNTKYIVSPTQIINEHLEFVSEIDHFFIYKNINYRPRAYTTDNYQEIKTIKYSPNEIVLDVDDVVTNKIILSNVFSPQWKAYNEQRQVSIMQTPNSLMQIEVPENSKTISVRYSPYTNLFTKI